MKDIVLHPIGTVQSTRKEIRDDNWDEETAFIELDPDIFTNEALMGLEEFSHAEILFHMDRVDPLKIEKVARRPRNNEAWPKIGIFAQRGKNRPNQIGTTVCKILKVEGLKLYLEGLDAVDATPVLDIKPWVNEFAPRGNIYQPLWITELMQEYWNAKDI